MTQTLTLHGSTVAARNCDQIDPSDVSFDVDAVAASLASHDTLPADAAAAIVSEWYDVDVSAGDGIEQFNGSVYFPDAGIRVNSSALSLTTPRNAPTAGWVVIPVARNTRVLSINGERIVEYE